MSKCNREAYIALFGSVAEAVEFEETVLHSLEQSFFENKPKTWIAIKAVMDGEEPTELYWTFLINEAEEAIK